MRCINSLLEIIQNAHESLQLIELLYLPHSIQNGFS